MGPKEMFPRILTELADAVAKSLSMAVSGEVPSDWEKDNIVSISKKCGKEDPGTYQPVSLTSENLPPRSCAQAHRGQGGD